MERSFSFEQAVASSSLQTTLMCRPCLIRKAQDGESGEELPITAGTRDSEIIGYGQVPFQPPRYLTV